MNTNQNKDIGTTPAHGEVTRSSGGNGCVEGSLETDPAVCSAAGDQDRKSYGQILKSSSIIGGVQGINYIIGMLRVKLLAVMLGPSGVGLLGLYTSAIGLISIIAGLGLDSSGVREVAEAHESGDRHKIASTILTLRRICWITGSIGWLICVTLSYPLSIYTFGSSERACAIATLGVTILIAAVSGGQSAIIQGTRRIGDLARMGVLSSVTSTIAVVGLYWRLGQDGIVPAMVISAAINMGFSWWFARKISIIPISYTMRETVRNSRHLIRIGIAFMYGAVLASLVALTMRSQIVKNYGLDANGIYQAAWAISGMFGGFIINAMGTDFYPRLTAVSQNNTLVNRLVNEQAEIGILLALPGLLGTLVFAPFIMMTFYSTKFLAGADMLPWFVMGVFGQVLIFPPGMITRAKGAVRWIYIGQTWANLSYFILASILLSKYGIMGLAYASPVCITLQGVLVLSITRHLTDFRWSRSVLVLIMIAVLLIAAALGTRQIPNLITRLSVGTILAAIGCLVSLRGITSRLGEEHRIIQLAMKIPGGKFAIGIK